MFEHVQLRVNTIIPDISIVFSGDKQGIIGICQKSAPPGRVETGQEKWIFISEMSLHPTERTAGLVTWHVYSKNFELNLCSTDPL